MPNKILILDNIHHPMSKAHDVGRAAGFFEGEGYVGFKYFRNKAYNRDYPRLTISIAQVSREPLDKFKEIFQSGTVNGPYGPYSTTRQAHYQYAASGDKALEIIEKMLPYLFRKGTQAREAILAYKDYLNAR